MKTKELIKKANDLRLIGASIKDAYISFCETTTGIEFYKYPVWGIDRGDGYAELKNAGDIYMADLFELMDLLDEFMKTPGLEREDEKRYWLRKIPVPLLDKTKGDVWYYKHKQPWGSFGVDKDKTEDKDYQTIFTESEISQMDITGFEKVEVTE